MGRNQAPFFKRRLWGRGWFDTYKCGMEPRGSIPPAMTAIYLLTDYAQRRRALHSTFLVSAAAASASRPLSICRLFFSIFFRCPKPAFPLFFITPSLPREAEGHDD